MASVFLFAAISAIRSFDPAHIGTAPFVFSSPAPFKADAFLPAQAIFYILTSISLQLPYIVAFSVCRFFYPRFLENTDFSFHFSSSAAGI